MPGNDEYDAQSEDFGTVRNLFVSRLDSGSRFPASQPTLPWVEATDRSGWWTATSRLEPTSDRGPSHVAVTNTMRGSKSRFLCGGESQVAAATSPALPQSPIIQQLPDPIGTTSMVGKWRQTTGLSGSGMAHNRPLCYLSCVIILKKGGSCLCARVKPHRHPQKPCRHPDPQCKPLPNKKYEARMNIHLAAESAFA